MKDKDMLAVELWGSSIIETLCIPRLQKYLNDFWRVSSDSRLMATDDLKDLSASTQIPPIKHYAVYRAISSDGVDCHLENGSFVPVSSANIFTNQNPPEGKRLTVQGKMLQDDYIKQYSGRACACVPMLGVWCDMCKHPGSDKMIWQNEANYEEVPQERSDIVADHVYHKKVSEW